MVHGHYNGKQITDPSVRVLFTRENVLASQWYRNRLLIKQERDIALWTRHAAYLKAFMARPSHREESVRLALAERVQHVTGKLALVSSPAYLERLHGTIGADPMSKSVNTMSAKA
jgi:hypothetical protein